MVNAPSGPNSMPSPPTPRHFPTRAALSGRPPWKVPAWASPPWGPLLAARAAKPHLAGCTRTGSRSGAMRSATGSAWRFSPSGRETAPRRRPARQRWSVAQQRAVARTFPTPAPPAFLTYSCLDMVRLQRRGCFPAGDAIHPQAGPPMTQTLAVSSAAPPPAVASAGAVPRTRPRRLPAAAQRPGLLRPSPAHRPSAPRPAAPARPGPAAAAEIRAHQLRRRRR